ncbi:MAG: hypothetical protein ACI9BW_004138 [Gammaproteobacteria bacterium]|jgi:hypothetical protein
MPAGKEIASFTGKFSSIRVIEVGDDTRVLEGTYQATISGELNGSANGSITFDGRSERGTLVDRGVGFFDSGDVVNAKGQGVYWLGKQGSWEVRAAYQIGDQMVVSEGQVTMVGDDVSLTGKIYELT